MFRFLLLSFLLLPNYFSTAQEIFWDGKSESQDIGQSVWVFEDEKGEFSIEQVSSEDIADKFRRSESTILNFGPTTSSYWLKISVSNESESETVLELAQPFLEFADLYFRDDSGKWQMISAGLNVRLNSRLVKHHTSCFSLPSGTHEYFINLKSFQTPTPIRLWASDAFETKTTSQKITYGLYSGILLCVILYNIFLFFTLRRWAYIHYASLVLLYLFIAAAVMDGFALFLFPGIDLLFWYFLLPPLTQMNVTFYAVFFLEVKKFSKKLYVPSLVIAVLFLVSTLATFQIPAVPRMLIQQASALIVLSLMFILGFSVARKGNPVGYYLAIAYFIYFTIVIVEIIYVRTGSPAYLSGISHVSIAIFVEALLLAYALSKRFQWERMAMQKDKEEAQQQLIETTKENERIVLEQNIILEQKVEERTHELSNVNENLNISLKNVEAERQKSETLLLNILPAATAQELKDYGRALPRYYESVTVIFADIKDFTSTTANLPPERIVNDLDYCFREFDRIVQNFGIEKIKTIGDAYMAAGGLPEPKKDHAIHSVRAALAMLEFIEQWKIRQQQSGSNIWELRIGINSGPVVSGVVGVHKFAYDIWGDTVNAAERMESFGAPGKVNISDSTYRLVSDHFYCHSRGKIEVKGKGELEMFFVEGEKK